MMLVNVSRKTGFTASGAIAIACCACGIAEASSKDVPHTAREAYTCKDEAKRFENWAAIPGTLDVERLDEHPDVRLVEVEAGDGRILRGISSRGNQPAKDAVLVIGGNAWSARPFLSSVMPNFELYAADVYYFDYRGYGLSRPANASMQAFLQDYRDIARWLAHQGHERLFLYGYSFGGVVALASFPEVRPFQQMVIDAAPSRASDLGIQCSPTYETVELLPQRCAAITIMHGTSDWVVPRALVEELIESARRCGAGIDVTTRRGHPFQAEWNSSRARRVETVLRHFGISRRP